MKTLADLTDEELVKTCWRELPEMTTAFDELVNRYKDYVFSVSQSRLQNREDSEDATQEVFVRIFFGLKKFRLEAQLKSWITQIAINVCMTILLTRKRRFWKYHVSLDGDVDVQNIYNTLFTESQEKTFFERIGRILKNMTGEYRKIFILKYFKNHSLQQMKTIFNTTLGAIKMKVKRAKDQFLTILKGAGDGA